MKRPQKALIWPHGVKSTAGSSTMVWGHRGASHAEQQNTPAAFERAIAMGAHGVELDVRRTADDVLVVHHDADLSDGRFIVETPSAQLPEWVPTLRWVLELYRDLYVNIEVKSVAAEPDFAADYPVVDLLLETLALSDPGNRHIVTSFDAEVLRRVQAGESKISTGLISYDPTIKKEVAQLSAAGHAAVMADFRMVDADFVDEAHANGLFVGVWTVNDARAVRQLQLVGVDAIMTDMPDMALAALAEDG